MCVCVWSILELLDPIYQGIDVPWKAHGKHLLLFTIRFLGVTLGHVPITQFKEAKTTSKLDCIWCWQIDCRLLLINYVWSQSSWDIRQPILEEVANISKKDKYVGPLLNIDIYMGPGGQRFFFSAANLPFFSGSNHQMFQILVDPTVPMWIQ